MFENFPSLRLLVALMAVGALVAVMSATTGAEAGLFTKLLREAAEQGGKAGKHGIGALDDVSRVVKALPDKPNTTAIAAHATPEGHWTFVNRSGESYTAANADELARLADNLVPDKVRGNTQLELYLSEDTVFNRRALLKDLPPDAELHMTLGRESFVIGHPPKTGTEKLRAVIRPNVAVNLTSAKAFEEALWQLNRRLNAADVRVLSLEPGATGRLSATPRFDKVKKTAMVDLVDPWKLETAFESVRGQTAVVTGRVEGGTLYFKPKSGSEQKIALSTLTTAANQADVNLVVLRAAATQPGGRNWFWQTVEVDGLDQAVKRATFADFINALGAGRGQFQVTAKATSRNRVVLEIVPDGLASQPISGTVGKWIQAVVSNVTGSVITSAIDVHANSKQQQTEFDSRFVSWLPSAYQYAYLGSIVVGLLGFGYIRRWWAAVWPAEEVKNYSSDTGYWAARAARVLVFIFLFWPIVGIPAAVCSSAVQIYNIIMIPFRCLGWLFRKLRPS